MAKPKRPRTRDRRTQELVLLKDLVPRKDPKGGGAAKTIFGDPLAASGEGTSRPAERNPGKKTK